MKMRIYSLTLLAAILLIALIACGKGGPVESGLSKGETGKVSASHRPGHGGGGGGGGDDGGGGGGGGGTPGPGDWNQFGRDAQNTGRSSLAGPATAKQKFAYQPGSIYFKGGASFAADGTAYIGGQDDFLYAINPNGTLKWKFQIATSFRGTPAVGSDGTVYASSTDAFYAVNPDGTLRWTFETAPNARHLNTPALASDGSIYFASNTGALFGLNPDGSLKWSAEFANAALSGVAVGFDGTVYVPVDYGYDGGALKAFGADGELMWTYSTDTVYVSTPVLDADGTIFFHVDRTLYALNSDGSLQWSSEVFDRENDRISSLALGADGTLYLAAGFSPSDTNYFLAVNPGGSLKWSFAFESGNCIGGSAAIDSNGTVYVGTSSAVWLENKSGKVFAINPDGSLKWSFTTSGKKPGGLKGGDVGPISIGQDGSVYFPCSDYRLYALGPGAG